MIFIRKHGNQIAEHMRRRRKAVQEQNGGSIPGTGLAIEDFQPLHVKRAIENGRRNRVRHIKLSFGYAAWALGNPRVLSDESGRTRMIVFPLIRSVGLKA